jgi:hypothetical protein
VRTGIRNAIGRHFQFANGVALLFDHLMKPELHWLPMIFRHISQPDAKCRSIFFQAPQTALRVSKSNLL